jgi:hypothetical protein
VLFARNSLKRPQTLQGQQNVLLPPAKAYTALTQELKYGRRFSEQVLLPITGIEYKYPRFWKRPPTRVNRVPVYYMRQRKLKRSLRRGRKWEFAHRRFMRHRGPKYKASTKKLADIVLRKTKPAKRAAVAALLRVGAQLSDALAARRSVRFRVPRGKLTPMLPRTRKCSVLRTEKVTAVSSKLRGL